MGLDYGWASFANLWLFGCKFGLGSEVTLGRRGVVLGLGGCSRPSGHLKVGEYVTDISHRGDEYIDVVDLLEVFIMIAGIDVVVAASAASYSGTLGVGVFGSNGYVLILFGLTPLLLMSITLVALSTDISCLTVRCCFARGDDEHLVVWWKSCGVDHSMSLEGFCLCLPFATDRGLGSF